MGKEFNKPESVKYKVDDQYLGSFRKALQEKYPQANEAEIEAIAWTEIHRAWLGDLASDSWPEDEADISSGEGLQVNKEKTVFKNQK